MPIKSCADKLGYEMATFGNPPVFPKDVENEKEQEVDVEGELLKKEKAKKVS